MCSMSLRLSGPASSGGVAISRLLVGMMAMSV